MHLHFHSFKIKVSANPESYRSPCRTICLLPFLASGGCQPPLACSCITPIFVCLHTAFSSVCLLLFSAYQIYLYLLLIRMHVMALRAHEDNQGWSPHLKTPNCIWNMGHVAWEKLHVGHQGKESSGGNTIEAVPSGSRKLRRLSSQPPGPWGGVRMLHPVHRSGKAGSSCREISLPFKLPHS